MVPHFEKMLYDQALLARRLPPRLAGHRRRRGTARCSTRRSSYVLRDLRHADGGFYSAEDADSRGPEEGAFYVWSLDEVAAAARRPAERADAAIEWYGVTAGGNFEGPNILRRPVGGDLHALARRRAGPPRASSTPASSASAPASTTRCSPSGTA